MDITPALIGALMVTTAMTRPAAAEVPPSPRRIEIADPLPYGQQPIDYLGRDTDTAVDRLQRRLAAGQDVLRYDERFGYLRSLLEVLQIPVESQVLVFSKSALNPELVGPDNPRAVYFNDHVYAAWVPGAPTVELLAIDPSQGAVFYTVHSLTPPPAPSGNGAQGEGPRIRRETRCLTCHAGSNTLHVPAPTVRSFLTDEHGKPIAGYSRITHQTPLSKRWGGWYVTGTVNGQRHLGNLIGKADGRLPHLLSPPGRAAEDEEHAALTGNVTDLKTYFDVSKYPSPHSDVVAHLVLEHQAHGHALLTRVNYEARLGRRSDAEEQLLWYLLFVDEAPLHGPMRGTSGFAEQFPKQGRRDSKGRSLRDLDLQTRLFRYRLSYLIDTPAFQRLPKDVKTRLYRRLWEVLSGIDVAPQFQKIPAAERRAIIEILRDTHEGLPAYWHQP